jgi:hypothetical protein
MTASINPRSSPEPRALSASENPSPEPLQEGPEPPDGFNYGGQTHYGLARKPFLAVAFLWSLPNRTARRDELAEPVWQDHAFTPSESAVQGLRKEINRFFRAKGIPWLALFKLDYLCLREGWPRKRKAKAPPKRARSKAGHTSR